MLQGVRVDPEPDRQRALRIEVDQQHPAAQLGQRRAQVDGGRGLADPALLVAHGDDQRGAVLVSGFGSGRSGQGRPVGPISDLGSLGVAIGAIGSGTGRAPDASATLPDRRATRPRAASRIRPDTPPAGARRQRPSRCPRCELSTLRNALARRRRIRRSLVRAGVGREVYLAEVVDGDQGVDLRGGHRGVAEQLLHHPDVGAAVQQVGGEASAAGCAATRRP